MGNRSDLFPLSGFIRTDTGPSGISGPDGGDMIELTKLSGQKILVNPDLIEIVEETPDTVVAFTTGRKIIVKESRQDIKNLVKSYRKDVFVR